MPHRSPAPGELALVETFANTHAYHGHDDDLATVDSANRWLADHGLSTVAAPEFPAIREVRDDIRGLIAGIEPEHATRLTGALAQHRIVPSISIEQGLLYACRPDDSPLRVLLTSLANGIGREDWSRLRVCANIDECGVAFYDRSRSRRGRWCSAQVCGNRINSRVYRARHRGVESR